MPWVPISDSEITHEYFGQGSMVDSVVSFNGGIIDSGDFTLNIDSSQGVVLVRITSLDYSASPTEFITTPNQFSWYEDPDTIYSINSGS